MAQFRVFIGAPSISDLKRDTGPYTWKTIEPPSAEVSQVLVYPPATLEAATRRISLLYQNIIFDESGEEAFDQEHVYGEGADLSQKGGSLHSSGCILGLTCTANQTTMISWPPTAANTTTALSFLRIS